MMCEVCISFAGDSEDNIIRFMAGHHPECPAFKINKSIFLQEFQRQVHASALELVKETISDVEFSNEERQSKKIINKLYGNLCNRYYPIVPNSYIFAWESDLLAVNNESQYITEYEIKISRNDFKADFKKQNKHQLIADCYQWKFSSHIPNYLYYATPPGLLDKSEIPRYAGLIEVGLGFRIVKRAPLLHKHTITQLDLDNLTRKLYHKYWKNNVTTNYNI